MPAYNEARHLAQWVPEVLQQLQALGLRIEIVLVNDGSRDDTAAVIAALCTVHPEVVGLDLSRNFGKEAALSAGLDAALGDLVLLMDADGQHPVSLVPDMLQRWREEGITTPVLILTARGQWHEKVAGIDAGADDYLAKPFHSEELQARLRALIRRSHGLASPVLSA